jgi:hypothetical protein
LTKDNRGGEGKEAGNFVFAARRMGKREKKRIEISISKEIRARLISVIYHRKIDGKRARASSGDVATKSNLIYGEALRVFYSLRLAVKRIGFFFMVERRRGAQVTVCCLLRSNLPM